MNDKPLDVDLVGRIFLEMLEDAKCAVQIALQDKAYTVGPEAAASPEGMLPIFLLAADSLWTRAAGRNLGIEIVPDPQALFHYRLQAIHHGPIAAVLLALAEVLRSTTTDGTVHAARLVEAWAESRRPSLAT
jgi:hypothetical protein